MTCQQFTEIVTDLIEGKVGAAVMAEIDAHLAECHGCTTYLGQMHRTIEALRNLAAEGGVDPVRCIPRVLTVEEASR